MDEIIGAGKRHLSRKASRRVDEGKRPEPSYEGSNLEKEPTMQRLSLYRLVYITGATIFMALLPEQVCKGDEVGLAAQIKREISAPERTGPLGGYAPIVDSVAPSVVSVFTTKQVKQRSLRDYPFFFEDPFFRRFFGDPSPESDPNFDRQLPDQRQRGLGSGVILTNDGYIVTNNHVIDGADEIEVQLYGESENYVAALIATDPATDLALLKIDAKKLPTATVGDSSLLKPGDIVLAIGNPFGLDQTVTTGIVSAIGRKKLDIAAYGNFIQTDASINPGNSGGALVDNQGRLIGINTAILSRVGGNIGIGFAIPVNMAIDILDRLSTEGEVVRGYLGVILGELTDKLARGFGVEPEGVLVNDVLDGTPAAKAGFEPGDIIVKFQGESVSDLGDLRMMVASTLPGTQAEFEVIRLGEKMTLITEIGRLPGESVAAPSGWGRSAPEEFLKGVGIRNIDEEARTLYRIPADVSGVLVARVEPDSNAAKAGMREGDVITSVGGNKVETVNQALKSRQAIKGNVVALRIVNQQGSRFIAVEIAR